MENKDKIRALFQKWKKERTDENFEKFYESSKQLVYKIAFIFLKNEEDSKDLVQDIFVKIYKLDKEKLPSYNETTWLYSITKNSAINFIKTKKPQVELDNIFELQDEKKEIDKIIEKEKFDSLIYNLPIKEQEIISLKILGNFTFKEIANFLDMKTSTVQWYYYKSLKTLRLLLGNLAMFAITFVLYLRASSKEKRLSSNEKTQEEIKATENSTETTRNENSEALRDDTNSEKNVMQNLETSESENNLEEEKSAENSLDENVQTDTQNNLQNDVQSNIQNNETVNNIQNETASQTTQSSNFVFKETSNSYLFASIIFFILTVIFSILFVNSQKKKKVNRDNK